MNVAQGNMLSQVNWSVDHQLLHGQWITVSTSREKGRFDVLVVAGRQRDSFLSVGVLLLLPYGI